MITVIKQDEYEVDPLDEDVVRINLDEVKRMCEEYDLDADKNKRNEIIYISDINNLWAWTAKNDERHFKHPGDAKWLLITTLLKYGVMLERKRNKNRK